MARPRAFDEKSVLDAAVEQFRVHGFAETSTEQLCAAAGLGRSSLYNAFTSKDELFVRALERYIEVISTCQESMLTDASLSGAERIRGVLDLVIAEEVQAAECGRAAGCMVVQSFMSPDVRERDPRIATMLDDDLNNRLALLESAIRVGQADGTVSPDVAAADGAVLVTTVISGIRITAQAGVSTQTLHRIALAGLRALLI